MSKKIKDYSGIKVGVSIILNFEKLIDAGNGKKKALWNCLCKCGKYHHKANNHIRSAIKKGQPLTCGNRICALKIEIGQKFGRLTLINFSNKRKKNGKSYISVSCNCECGNEIDSTPNRLTSGVTKSCGCLQKELTVKRSTTHNMSGTKELLLFRGAQERAKENKLPINIELSDIKIPNNCPVFKIRLNKKNFKVKNNSPSLDKIVPKKGYTKNNISVISYRANTIKSDGRLDEFIKIYEYMKRNIS
jgi:hypothetical protein